MDAHILYEGILAYLLIESGNEGTVGTKTYLVQTLCESSAKALFLMFFNRINNHLDPLEPGTRAFINARQDWLRKYLGVKRLSPAHSETEAFVKWLCQGRFAKLLKFERYPS